MNNPGAAPAPAAPQPQALLRLTLLGALIGLPTGLIAFAFIAVVHTIEGWLWHDLPTQLGATEPPWYLVVGLPALGGVLAYLARMLPGDGGHPPIEGVAGGGALGIRDAGSVALAALATLPFGLVLGPEAPLIALGTIFGVWLTSWAKLDKRASAVLGMAGSGAAMSTLFGGPLVAGMMLLEGGAALGAAIIPTMLPSLAAAGVAYVLITGLGDWTGLPMAGLAVSGLPEYTTVHLGDLVVAVVVGVLASVLAVIVRRLAGAVAAQEKRIGRLPLLLLGGLSVGLLALLARALGADSQDVLFSGQNSIVPLVTEPSVMVVAVLLIAKALGYIVSLGAGFRGGPIFPAIFIGVGLADFAEVAFGMSPTAAVAIGAAAGMAAMTRMLIAPILFASLLAGAAGLDAVPLATIGAVVAWLTSAIVDQFSQRRDLARTAEASTATAPAGTALPPPGQPQHPTPAAD